MSRPDVWILALRMAPAGPEVALLDRSGRSFLRERTGARAEALAALVAEALAEAGLDFADLEALAVLTGPGSFTATRAAVAAARGLALATGLPVHALSALELAAETATGADPGPLLVLGPAGRVVLAAQRFVARAGALAPPVLLELEAALAAARAAERVVLVDLEDWAGPPGLRVRSDALSLARAVAARAARGIAPVAGPSVRPLYLRPPDARLEAGRPLVVAA